MAMIAHTGHGTAASDIGSVRSVSASSLQRQRLTFAPEPHGHSAFGPSLMCGMVAGLTGAAFTNTGSNLPSALSIFLQAHFLIFKPEPHGQGEFALIFIVAPFLEGSRDRVPPEVELALIPNIQAHCSWKASQAGVAGGDKTGDYTGWMSCPDKKTVAERVQSDRAKSKTRTDLRAGMVATSALLFSQSENASLRDADRHGKFHPQLSYNLTNRLDEFIMAAATAKRGLARVLSALKKAWP